MIEFTFYYLFLLLPLPLLLRRLLPSYRESTPAVRTPFFEDLAQILGKEKQQQVTFQPLEQKVVFTICWALLILALTRPQYIEDPVVKNVSTRDMLLAVDLSGSMETEDFTNSTGQTVNRLEAVKEVLHDFLTRRQGDQVGLLFFGSAPFIQVPFTKDLEVCTTLLDEAQVGMASPQTMLGDVIGLAITIFEKSDIQDKVLILLTDGNDTGSRIPPEEAAKIASDKNIVIHTIAVGDPAAAGETELDEETLQAIARISHGNFYHANDREELQAIYDQLDKLSTREVETISYSPKRDLFHWPLAALFSVSLLYHLLQAYRSLPHRIRGGVQ